MIRTWADDETGRNSVRPWTMPRITAMIQSMEDHVLCFGGVNHVRLPLIR